MARNSLSAIREGRVHWKARLTAPVTEPRAEDLLVFSVPLPTGVWVRVDIIPGKPAAGSAITRRSGVCTVSYPNLKVTIDEASATLTGLEASGSSLLAEPLGLDLYAVQEGTIAFTGSLGCTYDPPTLTIKKGAKLESPKARLASSLFFPRADRIEFCDRTGRGARAGFDLPDSSQRPDRDHFR